MTKNMCWIPLSFALALTGCERDQALHESSEQAGLTHPAEALVVDDEEAAAAFEEPWRVALYGALRNINLHGDISPAVDLREALSPGEQGPNFGLGALGHLSGEITLYDGELFLAHALEEDNVRYEPAAKAGDLEATLFFGARVQEWQQVVLPADTPLAGIEDVLRSNSESADIEKYGPLPFRLEGSVRDLRWHVVDARKLPDGGGSCDERRDASIKEVAAEVPARIFGLFSTRHQGVIVDHTTNLHLHVVLADGRSGHVDDVMVPAGTTLWLPRGARPSTPAAPHQEL